MTWLWVRPVSCSDVGYFLVRTVHTVQQTLEISQVLFFGWLVTRLSLCNDRCLGWIAQKLWSPAVAVLVGVVQFLDKVVVLVGTTAAGRAMLGSTMDTCYYPGRLLEEF